MLPLPLLLPGPEFIDAPPAMLGGSYIGLCTWPSMLLESPPDFTKDALPDAAGEYAGE